jgi:hypothetical protein
MAFQHIKFLLVNRINVSQLAEWRKQYYAERLGYFTEIITTAFEKLQLKALQDFYVQVKEFAELHKSRIYKPYP